MRYSLRIFWPQKISNDQLLSQTKQEDIRTLVNRRRWRWIGHVMRKGSNNIARIAMHWTPEGKRSRGRPKTTWRRTVEKRLRGLNYSWSTIEKLAKDRQGWKDFAAALCATQAWWVVSIPWKELTALNAARAHLDITAINYSLWKSAPKSADAYPRFKSRGMRKICIWNSCSDCASYDFMNVFIIVSFVLY